jgi:hypothetical protein
VSKSLRSIPDPVERAKTLHWRLKNSITIEKDDGEKIENGGLGYWAARDADKKLKKKGVLI